MLVKENIKRITCTICGRIISASNFKKHMKMHTNPSPSTARNQKPILYALDHDGLDCQFCGKTCKNRNSLCNHERLCRLNPNRQINVSGRQNLAAYQLRCKLEGIPAWNKGLTEKTDERIARRNAATREYYKTHPGTFTGKHHTEETKQKLSVIRKQYIKQHPDQVPYILNHSSKISYPEQYFIELFEKEQIKLMYHKQIGIYQLDFCDELKKLYVEIDGEQHYTDKRIFESDKKRTDYLSNLGWHGFRIRWSDYQKLSIEERQKLILDLKQFLGIV